MLEIMSESPDEDHRMKKMLMVVLLFLVCTTAFQEQKVFDFSGAAGVSPDQLAIGR